MPSIAVARAFTLLLDNGERFSFQPGLHQNVSEEIANHWWTKLFLSPDGEPPADTALVAPDSNGVQFLVQRATAAEDACDRLRAELARVTNAWNETDIRLRRALAQIENGEHEENAFEDEQTRSALEHVTEERDALRRRVQELENATEAATHKVEGLTEEMSAPAEEDQTSGEYTLRKRGRFYQVLKTSDTSVEVVARDIETRSEAEAKLAELKGA